MPSAAERAHAVEARCTRVSSTRPPVRRSADGRWSTYFAGWAVLLAALVVVSGCHESHECGTPESCNYVDDDCDGRIDEGFLGADGRYASLEHCGACGVACASVFPTAEETACELPPGAEGVARCVLVSCPEGSHRADDGSCAPDVPSLCLACTEDRDCALRLPGARCLAGRCGQPCDASRPCPTGFECLVDGDVGQCAPVGGDCTCTPDRLGVEIACLVERDAGACGGIRVCREDGFGECQPALTEACNQGDDDCDGLVDEGYVDVAGRYVGPLHCGACGVPCAAPGPNMDATCAAVGAAATCEVACVEGFVDVDGIAANGCECERWDGVGPPPAVGGDADCDGLPDDTDEFVYVTTQGNDANPGTLLAPMRTLGAAQVRARATNKDVLVARGTYEGPFDVVGGVSLFGGYSPDFRDRDLVLHPVVLERSAGEAGLPVLVCRRVDTPTVIDGFTLRGRDAIGAGAGSTALFSDGCGDGVQFSDLLILAGRGAPGARGRDSSARALDLGFGSLAELQGARGTEGRVGTSDGARCTTERGGDGGRKSCVGGDVSGGAGGSAGCPALGCRNGAPCGNGGCTDFTVGGVCDLDEALRQAVSNGSAALGSGASPGAAGGVTYNAPTNRGVCNFCDDNPSLLRTGDDGGDGATGTDGAAGLGCSAAARIDAATGRLVAAGGGAGADGRDGSGGGGGTAGSGYAVIGGTEGGCDDRAGGSGGGGGSGGCGAPGGSGGAGGGASVALLVRATAAGDGPSFQAVRVVTASGGDGGDGGIGAAGGVGGAGGLGGATRFWCARAGGRGGDGGSGGAGGGGGGGCGGGSHGIALVGPANDAYTDALTASVLVERAGVAGRGGDGGFSPRAPGGRGADGRDEAVLRLP